MDHAPMAVRVSKSAYVADLSNHLVASRHTSLAKEVNPEVRRSSGKSAWGIVYALLGAYALSGKIGAHVGNWMKGGNIRIFRNSRVTRLRL